MAEPRIARLYLYPDLRRRFEAGRDPFLSALNNVLVQQGFEVFLHGDGPDDLAAAGDRPGWPVFRMIDPPHPLGVTFRRVYFGSFFRIESHGRRWDWPVARAAFDPASVNPEKAARFAANWRKRLFGDVVPAKEGFVLVPLQGRLTEHRSFQTCSPLEMLETVLRADPRPIVATLHPREAYTAEDRAALRALADHPRLTVQEGGSDVLLPRCDYVVTQNSGTALRGYLLEKPAALFAGADFHHIVAKAADLGGAEAIAQAPHMQPDFAAYLWWFLRRHAIDASRPDAERRIIQALKRAGWPLT